MKTDLTDIVLVIDRSGSMQAVREDAEGGVNSFIEDQAKEPGDALLTLVQFDTEYEFVHRGVPIGEVPTYELHPRGGTALLDAVGRSIIETGNRLAAMDEKDRPGLVIFVVMTDGLENSSMEFTKAKINEMVEHQQSKYSWQFTFLGANQDAFAEAGAMGFARSGTANYATGKERAAYRSASSKIARMRKMCAVDEPIVNQFSLEEIEDMS